MPFPSNGMALWDGGNDNWVGPGSRRTAIRASRSGEPGDPLSGTCMAPLRCQGGEDMKKVEMAERLAARIGMNKVAARDAVYSVFAAIGEALTNGEEVRIVGFGTFGTRNRPARTGRNSQTGEVISIPASKSPSFKAGKALRDAVSDSQRP